MLWCPIGAHACWGWTLLWSFRPRDPVHEPLSAAREPVGIPLERRRWSTRHVHERIDPRSIIEAVRKKNGEDFVHGSLFRQLEENPPLREAVDFYKRNWSNRLIAGDSLLVMNSLLEKEGMAGKIQMPISIPLRHQIWLEFSAVRGQARGEGGKRR